MHAPCHSECSLSASPQPFKPGVQGETGIEATLGRGLAMYDLKEAQIHSETETDTHCLLAWSCDTILLAFRGTATKVNVLADLKVCTASAVTCLTSTPLDHLIRDMADKHVRNSVSSVSGPECAEVSLLASGWAPGRMPTP